MINVIGEPSPPLDEKPTAIPGERVSKDSNCGQKSPAHKSPNEKCGIDFNPHDFGRENGIGLFGAMVHIVRQTIGSGILMLPYAMKHLGLLNGTILILFVSLVYYHNLHVLVSVEYNLCRLLKLERLSFIGVIRRSFQRAPYPINKLQSVVPYLAHLCLSFPIGSSTYLIIMATNIQHMARHYDIQLNDKIIITSLIIPFILFTLRRDIVKILVPFSSITNLFTIIIIFVIIGNSFYSKTDSSPKLIGDFYFIPKAFSIFIQTLRCTAIILPLKNAMQNPKRFSDPCGSINVAGLCITLVYCTFSLTAYLNYGAEVQENILSNLPPKNYLSFVVYLLYTLSLVVNYVLTFFSSFDNLWSNELESQFEDGLLKTICEPAIRVGLNLLIYFLAVAVPRISLIAAISGTIAFLVDIALPPLVQILLQISEKRIKCLTVLKNLCIIAMSCALFCMSAVRCAREVIQLYVE